MRYILIHNALLNVRYMYAFHNALLYCFRRCDWTSHPLASTPPLHLANLVTQYWTLRCASSSAPTRASACSSQPTPTNCSSSACDRAPSKHRCHATSFTRATCYFACCASYAVVCAVQIDNLHRSGCSALALSADERYLATGGDRLIKIWSFSERHNSAAFQVRLLY